MMIRGQVPMEKHVATEQCKAGNHHQLARQLKKTTQEELAAPTTFQVAGCILESVTEFQYLGQVIAQDNSDLAACTRNVARAKAKWAEISRVRQRDGAKPPMAARFYLVIVSVVLLYGSKMWVITKQILDILKAFHNCCA